MLGIVHTFPLLCLHANVYWQTRARRRMMTQFCVIRTFDKLSATVASHYHVLLSALGISIYFNLVVEFGPQLD